MKSLAVNTPAPVKVKKPHRSLRGGYEEDAATKARREATAKRAREAHLRSERRAHGMSQLSEEEVTALTARLAKAEAEVEALRSAARADVAVPRMLAEFHAEAESAGASEPREAAAEMFISCVDAAWRSHLRKALGPREPSSEAVSPAPVPAPPPTPTPTPSLRAGETWDSTPGVTGIYIDDEWVQFVDDESRGVDQIARHDWQLRKVFPDGVCGEALHREEG